MCSFVVSLYSDLFTCNYYLHLTCIYVPCSLAKNHRELLLALEVNRSRHQMFYLVKEIFWIDIPCSLRQLKLDISKIVSCVAFHEVWPQWFRTCFDCISYEILV
jgi:hypothetical protein